jgi:hypothetical protein
VANNFSKSSFQKSSKASDFQQGKMPLDLLGSGILRAILGAPVYDLYRDREDASLKSAEA